MISIINEQKEVIPMKKVSIFIVLPDRRQQVIGVLTFVLLWPEPTAAHGSAEFQEFGLLARGGDEGGTSS